MVSTATLIQACIGCFAAGFIVCLVFKMLFLTPWVRAYFSGGRIGLPLILGMRLRGTPVNLVLDAHLALIHGGEPAPIMLVESLYIANKAKVQTGELLVELVREHQRRDSG